MSVPGHVASWPEPWSPLSPVLCFSRDVPVTRGLLFNSSLLTLLLNNNISSLGNYFGKEDVCALLSWVSCLQKDINPLLYTDVENCKDYFIHVFYVLLQIMTSWQFTDFGSSCIYLYFLSKQCQNSRVLFTTFMNSHC